LFAEALCSAAERRDYEALLKNRQPLFFTSFSATTRFCGEANYSGLRRNWQGQAGAPIDAA
ncbi:MAG: hypothetical protein V4582_01085, partial [Pseudomonadota bacterium]